MSTQRQKLVGQCCDKRVGLSPPNGGCDDCVFFFSCPGCNESPMQFRNSSGSSQGADSNMIVLFP